MRTAVAFRTLLLCGATLWVPQIANAQTAPVSIDELVVTAQRREQRLQDVPLPVTAVTAKQMEAQGIDSTRDLSRVTPGLTFTEGGPHSMPTLRGIGSRSSAPGDSSPVALYVDGVYMPSFGAGQFDFGGVERVEVLKGPQGTLFGRNATGGAMNFVTRSPTRDPVLQARVGYASFKEVTGGLYVAGPLTDNLTANLSAYFAEDEGYTRDILTGARLNSKDNYGYRGKLVLQATEDAKFTLSLDHNRNKSNQGFATTTINNNNNAVRLNPAAVTGSRRGEVALSFLPFARSTQSGGSLTSDFDFGGWALKSITAYRDSIAGGFIDNDVTNIPTSQLYFFTRNKTVTQEFLATSDGEGRLGWLGGLFYMYDVAERNPHRPSPTSSTIAQLDTVAVAPFGEVSYKFTDHLTGIAGLRYSYEGKHLVNSQNNVARVNASDSWRNASYRLTMQYVVDPQLNFYATRSTGFKSGTYNSTAFDGQPVRPEEVGAWSLGMKSSHGGIVLNADVFQYDYTDIQIQRAVDPALGTAALQNAAEAKIRGAEVEVRAPLGDHWDFNLGLTYLHARYSSFPDAEVLVPRGTGGNVSVARDVTGNPLFRAPDWTMNAGASYEQEMFGGTFEASGAIYYTSEYSYEPSNRIVQKPYTTLHLEASWSPAGERFRFTVWGDNLTDETYFRSANLSTAGDNATYAPPRQIGVRLAVKLGN